MKFIAYGVAWLFAAIAVAMLLIFWSSALGLLDFDDIQVKETYLWPGIVGGLIMGVGFILGGYCPGTSLVSVATLKVDGMFFLLGHIVGARNVPPSRVNEPDKELSKMLSDPLLVVCKTGQSSAKAAATLVKHGASEVATLKGGVLQWTADQYPVTRG